MEVKKSILTEIERRNQKEDAMRVLQSQENGEILSNLSILWRQIYDMEFGRNSDMEFQSEEWERISVSFHSFGISINGVRKLDKFSLGWFAGKMGNYCQVFIRSDASFEKKSGSLKDCVDILPVVLQFLSE